VKTTIWRSIACAAFIGTIVEAGVAHAGLIADENAKPGTATWDNMSAGNAQYDGVIDLYPADWSLQRGETVRLKVRSTTNYSLKVYRLGWYDGAGGREVLSLSDRPADPQPYPTTADPKTGLIAAGWHDSVSFGIDSAWMPGLYVAKITQPGGKQAMTYFVVRDDGATPKLPILLVVTAMTHQAYNGWPGPSRGGKSLYGFNSSPELPTDSISNQAVKVSRDRPFLVGGGTADVLRYEYPFIRWAEKNGFEVAYCNDDDLDRMPDLAKGRRALVISGHWEYVSEGAYGAFEQARNAGTNLLFMSGDTIAWRVRFEDSLKTMVGYKEGWRSDPETIAGDKAYFAGNIEEAKTHYRNVTRGWKSLGYYPSRGIDTRWPGIRITGIQSAGGWNDVDGPWGHLEIASTAPWFFEGTGFKVGDIVRDVMGYEFDSIHEGDPYFDPFRPPGVLKTGKLLRRSDGTEAGSTAYYKHSSGAEVVSWSAVNFAYVLDDYAAIGWPKSPVDPRMQKLISNLLTTWSSGVPTPSLPDAGSGGPIENDAGTTPVDPADAGAVIDDASVPSVDASTDPGVTAAPTPDQPIAPVGDTQQQSGGCSAGGHASRGMGAALALIAAALLASRRRAR